MSWPPEVVVGHLHYLLYMEMKYNLVIVPFFDFAALSFLGIVKPVTQVIEMRQSEESRSYYADTGALAYIHTCPLHSFCFRGSIEEQNKDHDASRNGNAYPKWQNARISLPGCSDLYIGLVLQSQVIM